MSVKIAINDVRIRTELYPGDMGYVIYLHGRLYSEEYGYGISMETYIALGFHEFYQQYDPSKDRVWVCEHEGRIVGFLLGMHRRKEEAQLRYFILAPAYRGIGLGKKLMGLYMDFLRERGYRRSYLWTTHELKTAASLYLRHGFRLVEEKPSMAFGKEVIEQRYDLYVVP
jgi:GNAT superfamily N-acetyltransferase